MRINIYFIILLFISITAHGSNGMQPEIEKAVNMARNIAKATSSNNFDYVIAQTHPKIVEIMGGRKQAIEIFRSLFKENDFKILEYSVGSVTQVVNKGDTIYVVIPTKMIMKFPDLKITSEGYLLSISKDKGNNWFFVDGTGLDKSPELISTILPDLPNELKLPKLPPKTIEESH